MAYYVNEDKPTNRVTIHIDTCMSAQERSKAPKNGQWLGPFRTRYEAARAAESTGRRDVGPCGHCLG